MNLRLFTKNRHLQSIHKCRRLPKKEMCKACIAISAAVLQTLRCAIRKQFTFLGKRKTSKQSTSTRDTHRLSLTLSKNLFMPLRCAYIALNVFSDNYHYWLSVNCVCVCQSCIITTQVSQHLKNVCCVNKMS